MNEYGWVGEVWTHHWGWSLFSTNQAASRQHWSLCFTCHLEPVRIYKLVYSTFLHLQRSGIEVQMENNIWKIMCKYVRKCRYMIICVTLSYRKNDEYVNGKENNTWRKFLVNDIWKKDMMSILFSASDPQFHSHRIFSQTLHSSFFPCDQTTHSTTPHFTPFARIPMRHLSYMLSLLSPSHLVTPHAPLR